MRKQYRIKKNETIKKILNQRDVRKDGRFSVFKAENDYPHFRYAISVSKKFGNAVERNLVKRRIRMVFHESEIDKPFDIFVIVHPTAKALDYWQIRSRLETLLKKHKLT